MPIFEYKCKKCGHKFEGLVLAKKKIKCPKCGSGSIEKLISSFGIAKESGSTESCDSGTCDINCPTCQL